MIKSKVKTTVKNGDQIERLKKLLERYSEAYVTIGVHEGAGKYTEGKNPPDVVQVALWNEFGTDTVPARSFVQSTVDEHRGDIEAVRNLAINNILEKGWTMEQALSMIGFRVQILIQNKIKSNVPPPYGTGKHGNGPEAVERAQRAKMKKGLRPDTLIASTLLLRSIAFKVYLK